MQLIADVIKAHTCCHLLCLGKVAASYECSGSLDNCHPLSLYNIVISTCVDVQLLMKLSLIDSTKTRCI